MATAAVIPAVTHWSVAADQTAMPAQSHQENSTRRKRV